MNKATCRSLGLLLTLLTAASVSNFAAKATPYATYLTNNAGTVSFRLNEAADSVSIVGNANTLTNNLGPRPIGLTVTNLTSSGLTGGVFLVIVRKSGINTPVGLSTNSMNAPRGIAVNNNPASPYFGRVYVANATAGGTGANARGDGIYIYYPDLTPDVATLTTNYHNAGYDFAAEGAANAGAPFRLTVAPSGELYIGDWSDATGNLIATDPNVTSHHYVLQQLTGTATLPVGSNNTHGSVQAVAVTGSTNTGNLVVYTVDEDYAQDPSSVLLNQWNSVWVYEIGAGPLPWTNPPNRLLCVPSINFLSQNDDVAIGPNGFLYFNQRRANSTANLTTWTPSLFVVDPAVYIDYTNYGPYSSGIYSNSIYDPAYTNWTGFQSNYYAHVNSGSGGWIWESQTATYEATGGTLVDRFQDANGIAVSPDGKYITGITFAQNPSANAIIIAPLTNGIPDITKILIINPGTTSAGRGVAWDVANNVYMISSGLATVRAYSLAFNSVAMTGSDGTFSILVPGSEVWAAATDNAGSESGDTATVTFYRNGDTSGPLTVNYTIAGTAGNGTDYTNSLGGNVVSNITFAAGQSSTNLNIAAVDDAIPETTETVILTILGSTNYTSLFNRAATVAILDNETAEIALTANGVNTNMYERVLNDFARFTLTRRGLTNTTVPVNLSYSGLVNFTDFNGPTSVSIDPGVITLNFNLNPIDNATINGTRTFSVSLAPAGGGEYTINTTNNTASGAIVDDDLPTENVIWSYNFDADEGIGFDVLPANWTYTFGATNNVADFNFNFGYNYSADSIPPPPGSATTVGLRATVNKQDALAFAAAINFYPTNIPAFTNDYALRFNTLIIVNTTSNNTEHAIFGINHSGTKTNWNVSGGSALNGTDQDGLFFSVGPTGGNLFDFALFTDGTNAASPLLVTNRAATTLTHVWKVPPYFGAGQPGMSYFSNTWTWLDVEIAQTTNMIALRINNTPIITTTNISPFKSGTIMLGYNDMFNSIGGYGGAILYDNVRVVSITTPVITTQPLGTTLVAGNNITLTVAATTTTGTTNYQWYRNGVAIAGATNASLSLTNFQSANAGTYTVVVDDGRYPVISQPAVLAVATAPTLLVSVTGTAVTLRFNSQVGPTYYTEYKDSLTNASWTPLSTNAGTGSQIIVNDNTLSSSTRFYRARAQ